MEINEAHRLEKVVRSRASSGSDGRGAGPRRRRNEGSRQTGWTWLLRLQLLNLSMRAGR